MGLFKKNIFGQYLLLKKWLIRILGTLTHRRYRGFNELVIEGSEIIKNLPDNNVLFVSNHQTLRSSQRNHAIRAFSKNICLRGSHNR